MEAVPRMPMLAFELKTSPEPVEFGSTLKSYITSAYNEDGNAYSKECSELDALRISAANVSRDFMGCSTLKKYFSQLKFLESRFPMGEGGPAAIPFTWDDSYTGRQISIADIRFEQAATMYNIGALHSILGALDNRQSPDGMKVSCTHFQCSAWAFQHLRDTYGSSAGIEFSHDFLTFQINLMLAQAQECILEKSMTDNRKSTITAKVAAQIVEYYRLALQHLEASNASNVIGSRKYKDWKKRMEMKSFYHRSVMYLHMGLQSEEQQKWGERVIWFSTALEQLQESMKLAKNEEGDIEEALRFTMDVVGGKFNNAKKDNDFVYHEKVPALDSLPEVKGASLVKGIPFNPTDPEVAGTDIFARLVPMAAHEASSLYSEEKAKLLRQVGSKVDEHDTELAQFLASLSLDSSVLNPEPFRLPQHLLEKCAALSVKPDTIQDLKKAMTSLSNVATDVGSMVEEIKALLLTEEQEENEFKESYGPRSPNTTLVDIGKECALLDEQRRKGANSDVALHKAMQNHINDLNLLALPPTELEKQLPSVEEVRTAEDEAIILEMKRLMGKIEEMQKQRDQFHSQLRQQVHDDDITTVLVTRELGDQESFFSEQLKKHDQLVTYLNQNISAQENILRAVTEANARFAPIRKATTETIARREAKISSLVASYEAYENLLDKSQRGMEYYKKLEEKGTRLLERAQAVVKAEHEERERRTARHKPKAPSPSRPTAPKPGQTFNAIGLPEGYSPPSIPEAYLPGSMPAGYIPPSMGSIPGASSPVKAPEMPRAPTLKDYLPFMKPATFGPKAPGNKAAAAASGAPPAGLDQYAMYAGTTSLSQVPQVPSYQGSLPSSQSGSPVHLPHQQPSSHPGSPAPSDAARSQVAGASYRGVPAGQIQPQHPGVPPQQAVPSSQQIPQQPSPLQPVQPSPGQQPSHVVGTPTQQPQPAQRPQSAPGIQPHPALGTQSLPPQQPAVQQHTVPQPQPSVQQHTVPQPQQSLPSAQPPNTQQAYQPASDTSTSQTPGAPSQGSMPQQATMRDGASHTVNMLNAPIASPEEAPSSYSGGQQGVWSAAAGQTTLPSGTTQQPTQQAPTAGYPSQVPASNQYTNQPPGAASSTTPYSQNLPQANQYTAYSNYAAGQTATPSTVSAGQYTQGPQVGSQVGAAKPQSEVLSAGQQSQYSMYNQPAAPQQYPQTYNATNYPMNTPPAQQGGAQQLRPNNQSQYTPISGASNNMAQTNTTSTYPQPYGGMQAGAAGYQQPQQPGTPSQGGVYQPTQNTTYQKPAVQAGATGYPGQQGYQTPASSGYGAMSQGYVYPNQQQQQPQSQSVAQKVANSSQNFRNNQIYTQQSGAKYPQGYTGPTQAQAPQESRYSQPQQASGSSASGPSRAGTQVGYTHPQSGQYSQQGQYSYTAGQYPTAGQNQVKTGYSAGQTAQQGYAAYGAAQPPVPTSQHPGQSQMGTGYGQATQTGQSQYQYYNQQGQQGMVLSTGQGYPQYNQQKQPYSSQQQQQPYSTQQQQQPYPTQQQQQYATPQQQKQQQYPNQQPLQPQQQQQYPIQQQKQYVNQAPQGQQQQQQQQSYGGQQIKSQPAVGVTGYSQAAYNQQQPYGQQYPAYSQGYNQYSQPYPQQSSQSGYTQPQQQLQQQQPQQQPYPAQPPTQLNTSQAPTPAQYIGSPLSPQANLPSPLQPMAPSPIQTSVQQPPQRASSAPPEGQPSPQLQSRPIERQNSHASTNSSLDDILSSSPNGTSESVKKDGMLTPKVITAEDLQQQKEEELKKTLKQQIKMDPYEDRGTLEKFVSEVEKFEKMVESLDKQTLSGPTPLDKEWKDLGDDQVKSGRQQSMGIARCYPTKNRTPEVMPYDSNRVLLKGTQDDYINASFIGDLAPCCPKFITTQSPVPVTIEDFWLMVQEQGTEVIVMLCHEDEMGMQKIHRYWPAEKNQPMQQGRFTLTLQSIKHKQFWVERIITLSHKEARQSRSVVHLQFLHWPPSGAPDSPNQILSFIAEVHTFYIQQRTLIRPVIVHCSDGVGRTGAFCIIYTAVQEVNQGNGVREVAELVRALRERRRYMVQEKEQLAFCYHAILYHCQSILIKRGIITNKASFGDKIPKPGEKSHQRKPSEDFILGNATSLSAIQSSVAKMTIKSSTPPPPGDLSQSDHEGLGLPINGAGPNVTTSVSTDNLPTMSTEPQLDATVSDPLVATLTEHPAVGSQSTSDQTLPGLVGSPVAQRSRSASGSSGLSHASLASASPQHQPDSNVSSLTDLQDPEKFSLDLSDIGKPKKFSKSEFHKGAGIKDAQDPSDPLSMLDPLWTVKDPPS